MGTLKESWLREGCAEYSKRLGSFTKLTVREVPEEAAPKSLSSKEAEQLLAREGAALLKALPENSHSIALTISGATYSSEGLAKRLEQLALGGISQLTFIIGSSLGLSAKVTAVSKEELSLGTFTYPHQLCRLILLEQLYRAFTIHKGMVYHK
ncbi:MAG: 23S rRNA (pseudouridine(1915)-N(3))-methyltransferase RlmH [Symbiobacteriaceae bacterium]|nr:23S rRNA (pseudouridine(1915)-N(3))-methyltransferase RlmH [Symbiobacteriaceae bacterium]